MLLPEDGVDLQVRRPELLLDIVGRGIFEIGKGQALAGSPEPGNVSSCYESTKVCPTLAALRLALRTRLRHQRAWRVLARSPWPACSCQHRAGGRAFSRRTCLVVQCLRPCLPGACADEVHM